MDPGDKWINGNKNTGTNFTKNSHGGHGSNGNNGSNNIVHHCHSIEYSSWNYRKIKNNMNRYSAGVLPYTYDLSGKCLFLLGKDNEGDWSDFGGRCEFKDRNDEKNTASREFYEETLGSVMNITDCVEKLTNGNPIKITSKTLNGSPYYMYLLYVDYINYSEVFTKVSNFLKYTHSNNSSSSSKIDIKGIIEKTTIRWVSLDTILNCIENRKTKSVIPLSLRGVFFDTINSSKETLIQLAK